MFIFGGGFCTLRDINRYLSLSGDFIQLDLVYSFHTVRSVTELCVYGILSYNINITLKQECHTHSGNNEIKPECNKCIS